MSRTKPLRTAADRINTGERIMTNIAMLRQMITEREAFKATLKPDTLLKHKKDGNYTLVDKVTPWGINTAGGFIPNRWVMNFEKVY